MNRFTKLCILLAVAVIAFACGTAAQGQTLSSSVAGVSMQLNVGESISIAALPPSSTFTYNATNGTAAAGQNITASYVWNLNPSRTKVTEYTWLTSATAALTGNGINIPSSDIFLSMNGNPAMPCTSSLGGPTVAGAACPNWTGSARVFNLPADEPYVNGGFGDVFIFTMANLPALPAGNYTGVVNFELVAQ